MSNRDRPLTEGDIAPLLGQLAQASGEIVQVVAAASSQSAASMLTNALLVRELGRAGIVNVETLKAEALERAQQFDEPAFRTAVVKAISGIFGDDMLAGVESARFKVIEGGLSEPPKG